MSTGVRFPPSSMAQTIVIQSPMDQNNLRRFTLSSGGFNNQPVSIFNQPVSQPLRTQVAQNDQIFGQSMSNMQNDNFNSLGQIGQNNLRPNLNDFNPVSFDNSLTRPIDDNAQFRLGSNYSKFESLIIWQRDFTEFFQKTDAIGCL